ncbi:glycosyltransferase family 2 protein [archaeon]|nr:glycosyltransferase family 2 protein [archaeon]
MKNTHIIIPALNEEKNIGNVINNLKKEGYHNLILVDDGSEDNTINIAEQAGAKVLKHIINRGQGAALQTGMTYALLNGAQYLVHFDADGQHDPKEIKSILKPLLKKEAEVTLGSRFLKKQKMPFIRKLTLKGAILIIWVFYGEKLSDAHNGFRAFTKEAAKKVTITTDKMEHASEIIDKIKKRKVKYKEVPVTIIYKEEHLKEGRKGQGQFDSIKILFKMIMEKLGT